jgi:Tol biopolymer transport system component
MMLVGLLVWLVVSFGEKSRERSSNSPKLFAPGVISGPADDLSPAFAPDGKTIFFTRRNGSASTIVTAAFADGRWSISGIAPFSGMWSDREPAMAPDGSFLVFASNRPEDQQGKPLDGNYNGKIFPGGGGNLWRVDRVGDTWGPPKRLPGTINESTGTFSPSISTDGSIYFMRADTGTGNFHLFRSQYHAGSYLPALPIAVGDMTTEDVDPAIAPDESYLVYSSSHPAKHEPKRLRITFRRGTAWSTPLDLGDDINEAGSNIEARLGPDHKTLYFSTNTVPPVSFPRSREQAQRDLAEMEVWANGSENIWYVSLGHWLASTPKK